MSDIGSKDGTIDLGTQNPSKSYPTTKASGINIHKPGHKNKTGMTNDGKAISQGCLLINLKKWVNFIDIFRKYENTGVKISVIVSRSISDAQIIIKK